MSDCRFCDRPLDAGEVEPGDEPEVCDFCDDLFWRGKAARGRMVPMGACPWYRGDPREANVLGDPDYHDVGPLRCP